jgi:hypothetical protein
MRVFYLAAFLACLGSQALAQQSTSGVLTPDGCSGAAASMNSAAMAYQAQMASLRSNPRTTAPANASKPELELIFRRYEATLRDLRERRGSLLALYRHQLAKNCPGYSAAGLSATITEYNLLATGEHRLLTTLRDSAGIWVAAGVQEMQTFR